MPSTKHGLPDIAGGTLGSSIDEWGIALIARLEQIMVTVDVGAIDDRPFSTVGTPGIRGRIWIATDLTALHPNRFTFDTGTSWIPLAIGRQIVAGSVGSDGVKISGGDQFESERLAPGDYVITYDLPFSAEPVVVAGALSTSGPDAGPGATYIVRSGSDETETRLLWTGDSAFHFVAIAP